MYQGHNGPTTLLSTGHQHPDNSTGGGRLTDAGTIKATLAGGTISFVSLFAITPFSELK